MFKTLRSCCSVVTSSGRRPSTDPQVSIRSSARPQRGPPIHVDLVLDGYRLGLASEESTRDDHGMDPVVVGQRAAVVLWTDDTARAYARLQQLGATPVKEPSPWLDRLLIAWVEDLDGHLIQLAQDVSSAAV